MMGFASSTLSQTCTGIISDPTVVIDFGSRAVRTTPLPQMAPSYQFTTQSCPPPGAYSVRNSTFQCFNNLWQVLPFDHTPNDVDGNFLLINAVPGNNPIYIDTIRNLCAGRVFQFGAWIANVVNPFQCSGPGATPNLDFSIYSLGGTLLGSYTTGDITPTQPASWTNRRFLFDLPAANTDVILKITDLSPAGCGDDFALDDLSFSPCSGELAVMLPNSSTSAFNVCEESQSNLVLTASFPGYTNPSIQWQVSTNDGFSWNNIPGATGTTYLRPPSAPGDFLYRFILLENGVAACRFSSKPVRVDIYNSPFAQGTNYVFGCYGSDVLLGAAGGSVYHWIGPNGFHSDLENPVIPHVDFGAEGQYIVKVTNSLGCSSYDTTDLNITLAPNASVAANQFSICDGQSVQLNANPGWRYKWLPAEGLSNDTIADPVASPTRNTTYVVKVYNEVITCYDTAQVKIVVWSKPKVNAGPDKFTYDQRPVFLEGTAAGTGLSYLWSPPAWLDNPRTLHPRATPLTTTTYTLTATSEHGCGTDSDRVEVKVIDSLLIPTAFTPNHDGLNDYWEIIAFTRYREATVDVFNRWGQKLYSSRAADYQPWDGSYQKQPVEPGTYVYYIRLKKKGPVLKGLLHIIL